MSETKQFQRNDYVYIVDAKAFPSIRTLFPQYVKMPFAVKDTDKQDKPYRVVWISEDERYVAVDTLSVLGSGRDFPPQILAAEFVELAHRPVFKQGDRVVLKKAPKIEKDSGWYGSRHFLIAGATGTVGAVDFKNAYVRFDDESWIDQQGKVQPCSSTHLYHFQEVQLEPIRSAAPANPLPDEIPPDQDYPYDQWMSYAALIQKLIHKTSKEKGFWDKGEQRNDAECMALIFSEVAEALEAVRAKVPPRSEKIPEFCLLEEELADVIIRVLDYAAARRLDVIGAVTAKMRYNETREFKHGKKF
jgi:NTP pyrophosphatase (non-canonical NTP hydrolase)